MNYIHHFFSHITQTINWSSFISQLIQKVGLILFLSLLCLILKRLITRNYQGLFQRIFPRQLKAGPQRMHTISKIIQNAFSYLLYFFYAYSLLSIVGVPVATLLAGAGIVGVALGLGVKDFITDLVNGFFIILEGQYEVGEFITLGDVAGTVIQVGIRTTLLQATNGNLIYIPNGDINIVQNHSRKDMRVLIEIPLNPTTHIENFIACTQVITDHIRQTYQTELKAEPNILGLNRDKYGNFQYSIIFYVTNGQQFKLTGEFYQLYLKALQEQGLMTDLPLRLTGQ